MLREKTLTSELRKDFLSPTSLWEVATVQAPTTQLLLKILYSRYTEFLEVVEGCLGSKKLTHRLIITTIIPLKLYVYILIELINNFIPINFDLFLIVRNNWIFIMIYLGVLP